MGRGRLFDTRWYLQAAQYVSPMGFIAILAGWYTTEVGRQPWIATGILRTADAVSPVHAMAVLTTLILFVVVYTIGVFDGHLLHQSPIESRPKGTAAATPGGVPSRPLTAAEPAAHDAIEGT